MSIVFTASSAFQNLLMFIYQLLVFLDVPCSIFKTNEDERDFFASYGRRHEHAAPEYVSERDWDAQ